MKLKVPFIIFNIVLFGLLFTIFLVPLFFADNSILREFWKTNYFFVPIFILIILVINIIYFTNRKLLEAIESEDWAALSMQLEEKIFTKNKISFKNANLLIEALFILGDFSTINRLETTLQNKKPNFIKRLSLKFAAAKILSGNYENLLKFTEKFKNGNNEWIDFYYAFSLYMVKDYQKSVVEYKKLQEHSDNKLVKVLSSYFLLNVLKDFNKLPKEKSEAIFINLKNTITTAYSIAKWNKFIDNEKKEIHIMVLTKVIDSATNWVFDKDENKLL